MIVKEEINDVKLIDTKRQLAEPLTKATATATASSENLSQVLLSKETSAVHFNKLKQHQLCFVNTYRQYYSVHKIY